MNRGRPGRLLVVVGVLLCAFCVTWVAAGPVGAARTGQSSRASTCNGNDTSGSCSTAHWVIRITFPKCVSRTSTCPPDVIHLKADKHHPYGLDITIPAPKKGWPSIVAGDTLLVTMDASGNFTLRMIDKHGHVLTSWNPRMSLKPPAGYRILTTLTKRGWRVVNYTRVDERGIYRWLKR